jgi:AmiR/NasT family two-component response regulator
MPNGERSPLRVLIANEHTERLAELAAIVRGLGHETIAAEIEIAKVGLATAREHPDVALVGVGRSTTHALNLISKIVAEAECPVIAVLPASDASFIRKAASRGVFAYVFDADPASMESAIEIVLSRFSEYHGLQGAFGRRALIERAKGILMERHGIDEGAAFELLRSHARRTNAKVADVASSLVDGHRLLPPI